MTNPTGGPAFPGKAFTRGGHPNGESMGMTLRDWFAGQAIRARWGDGQAMTAEEAANMAYQLADAMLDARTKEPGHD